MRISNWVWVTLLGFGGCSFLLHSEQRQCNADADCRVFSQTATCAANVCVEPELPDSGGSQDAAVPFDAGVVDAGPAMGPPGCFSGAPKTDVEFFNSCTEASYLSFDNCARAGLCDGGAEVAIAKPDAGPAAPSTPLDGGPTESCYDATARPNVIYMNGSTNFTPFIRAMVPLVANNGFVIVWQPTSSCTGADTAFNPDPAKRVMKNPTTTSQTAASYYTTSNLPGGTPCLLGNGPNAPAPNQEYVDIGQSDIFATSCPQTSGASPFSTYVPDQDPYAMVHHYEGAAQAMALSCPRARAKSDQRRPREWCSAPAFGPVGST